MGVVRRKWYGLLTVGLLLTLGVSVASAQNSAPEDATQALLGAFNNYSIVAVDDAMIIQQAADFYTSLVTNPTFESSVGNVVVDFGNSADQSIVDNYLAGQGSDSDLAQIWVGAGANLAAFANRGAGGNNGAAAATPQVIAAPQSYTSFLSAIRTANQSSSNKIKVWLAGQAFTRGQGQNGGAAATQQAPSGNGNGGNGGGRGFGGGFGGGQFLANLIETQILSQNKKALVIANIAQFNPNGLAFGGFGGRGFRGGNGNGNGGAAATQQAPQGTQQAFTPPQDVRQILEKDYLGKTIVAVVHRGMQEAGCNTNLEGIMASWKAPVVASIKGTPLQAALTAQNCHEFGSFGQASINEGWADGYLYLGPVASLTISPAAGQQAMSYLDYVQQMQQQFQQFFQNRQPQATQPPASS